MFGGFASKERTLKPLQFSMFNFVCPPSITRLKFKLKTILTWYLQAVKWFFKIFKFGRIFTPTIALRGSHEYRIRANFELFSWLLSDYIVINTTSLKSRGSKALKLRKMTMARKRQNCQEIDTCSCRRFASPLSLSHGPSRFKKRETSGNEAARLFLARLFRHLANEHNFWNRSAFLKKHQIPSRSLNFSMEILWKFLSAGHLVHLRPCPAAGHLAQHNL